MTSHHNSHDAIRAIPQYRSRMDRPGYACRAALRCGRAHVPLHLDHEVGRLAAIDNYPFGHAAAALRQPCDEDHRSTRKAAMREIIVAESSAAGVSPDSGLVADPRGARSRINALVGPAKRSQLVVLKQGAVLQRLVPSFDLCLGMERRTADVIEAVVF